MKSKENLAVSYTFFRFPAHYVLLVLPFVIAITIFYFSSTLLVIEPDEGVISSIAQYRDETMMEFLLNIKIIISIILSFFLTYRWSVMEKDGKYGFWLTQGIKRRNFFGLALFFFYIEVILSSLAAIIYLYLPGGLLFDSGDFITLSLLLVVSYIFSVGMGILVAEVIGNSEFALLAYVTLFTGQALIFDQLPDILVSIFFLEQLFLETDLVVPILTSIVSSIIVFGIAYFVHNWRDVEL